MQVSLTVNGRSVTSDVEGRTLLSDLLRDRLGLTGTHRGCDTAQCGACTVHVDGHIGDPQVRNCGTIGGSLANNDPAADYPAAAYRASLVSVIAQRAVEAACA